MDDISDLQAVELLESVGALLGLFLVNETRYPSAGGKRRYNGIDFQTLRFVDEFPGIRGAELARLIGIAPTTQQSALDRLIRQGLVNRQPHSDYKNGKAHRLTPKGKDLRQAINAQDITNMKAILSTLEEDERTLAIEILGKIAKGLEA